MSDIYINRIISSLDTSSIVMRYHETPFTGPQLLSSIYQYARYLSDLGIGPSSLVGLYAPNNPEALTARYAISLLGAAYIYLPLYPDALDRRAMLLGTAPDVLIVFRETHWTLEGLGTEWQGRIKQVGVGLDGEGIQRLEPTLSSSDVSRTPTVFTTSKVQPEAMCCIVSSGGSTGHPKASWRTFSQFTALATVPITPDRRQLINGPLANLSHVLLDATLMGGGTVILDDDFDVDRMLHLIQSEGVTDFFLVEPQLAMFLEHPDLASVDFSKVRSVSHVGDNAPLTLREKAVAVFGPRMRQTYGASEAAMVAVFAGADYLSVMPGMANPCGRILPGIEIRIRSPLTGEILPDGQPGRIEVKAAANASGYKPELQVTSPAPRFTGDNTVLMNDIGKKYGDLLEFIGREVDVVFSGTWGDGEPTTAIMLQDTLLKVGDEVKHAAAFRDGKLGAWIAIVVPKPLAVVDVSVVEKRLMAKHKIDKLHALIVQQIPLTPQGKVNRTAVIAALAEKMTSKSD